MARVAARAISCGITLARRLCTAAAAEEEAGAAAAAAAASASASAKGKALYRRLSALGAEPSASAAETMNGWVREKKAVSKPELIGYVKALRRYKKHKHALEVIQRGKGRTLSTLTSSSHITIIHK